MQEENEKLKLLTEISEIHQIIRPKMILISIYVILHAITMIVAIVEIFRIGLLDSRTIAWYILTVIFHILAKTNAPSKTIMERYNNLIREFNEKGYKE